MSEIPTRNSTTRSMLRGLSIHPSSLSRSPVVAATGATDSTATVAGGWCGAHRVFGVDAPGVDYAEPRGGGASQVEVTSRDCATPVVDPARYCSLAVAEGNHGAEREVWRR